MVIEENCEQIAVIEKTIQTNHRFVLGLTTIKPLLVRGFFIAD